MLKITISEYMVNPGGKGSSVIPNRQLIIDDLKARYYKLKKDRPFDMDIYKVGNDYFFHILVPSEDPETDIKYDVVVQFTMAGEDFKNELLLKRYYLKLFSNSPSFVYSYAYVYHKNGILTDYMEKKFKDIELKSSPDIRNPREVISFEKTTYFACLHLTESVGLLNKMYLDGHLKGTKITPLVKNVRTIDAMLLKIKKAKQKKSKAKEKQKRLDSINSHFSDRGEAKKQVATKKDTGKKSKTLPKKKAKAKIGTKKSTFKK